MALRRLSIPNALALPCRPILARVHDLTACEQVGEELLPGLAEGELVNIVGGVPGGSFVFGVVCANPSTGDQRAGWLPGNALRVLSPEELADVSEEAHLSLRDLFQYVSLASGKEDWQDPDYPSALSLRAGEFLQLITVKEGWAFGWSLENPQRRGWFPVARVQPVEPSLSSLVKREVKELSPAAAASWVELLRAVPIPPARQRIWDGELPPAVVESARQAERQWQEDVALLSAQADQAAAESAQAEIDDPDTAGGAGVVEEKRVESIEELPEDACPLVVCKMSFEPPKGTVGPMLQLQIGDLVRVTTDLDANMYHGFFEGCRNKSSGWFPRRNVQLLEDPLDVQTDNLPAEIGPPPLPMVPPSLQKRRM